MTIYHLERRLLAVATMFAQRSQDEAETAISEHVADAIARWELDEATFWQRVKFKARLLRAAHGRSPAWSAGGEEAC